MKGDNVWFEGVEVPLIANKERKLLLLVGTSTSGIRQLATMLSRSWRTPIGFESVEIAGTASRWFCVDADRYPCKGAKTGHGHYRERLGNYKFSHVIHVVRTPLYDVAELACKTLPSEFDWWERYGGATFTSPVQHRKAAQLWSYINIKASKIAAETHFLSSDLIYRLAEICNAPQTSMSASLHLENLKALERNDMASKDAIDWIPNEGFDWYRNLVFEQ